MIFGKFANIHVPGGRFSQALVPTLKVSWLFGGKPTELSEPPGVHGTWRASNSSMSGSINVLQNQDITSTSQAKSRSLEHTVCGQLVICGYINSYITMRRGGVIKTRQSSGSKMNTRVHARPQITLHMRKQTLWIITRSKSPVGRTTLAQPRRSRHPQGG